MKVLVACEYSGRVRDAFREKGHDAVSCDLLPTDQSGPHYQGDVLDIIGDGWDLMIAHPPCTYLTGAAEWAYGDGPYHQRVKPETLTGAPRRKARADALSFVSALWNSGIPRIALENPVGVINKNLECMPKPQYIQQYDFGEDASKKTGLWLKNLPKLLPTGFVKPRMVCGCGHSFEYDLGAYGCANCCGDCGPAKQRWKNQTDSGQNRESPGGDRWKTRSTTPLGIALAMAEQWG